MVVPKEPSNRFALDEAGVFVLMCLSVFAVVHLLLHTDRLPRFDEANPHEEDITRLDFDIAFAHNFFDLLECDSVATHTTQFDACQIKDERVSSLPRSASFPHVTTHPSSRRRRHSR